MCAITEMITTKDGAKPGNLQKRTTAYAPTNTTLCQPTATFKLENTKTEREEQM
jgi:hypothetical protein